MKWQILIPHMPHRHAKLVELLDVLAEQMQPGVEVVVFTDNLELPYREKLQTLYDAATAEYVSSLGNDDLVARHFIPRVLEALREKPDYVGFHVRYTEAGQLQRPVIHSLACGGWGEDSRAIYRDLMYYNPIRRDLAQQVRFRGDFCDVEWGDDLRALGIVKNEVLIPDEMVYYQRNVADNFHTQRTPMPEDEIPALPEYPFVRHMVYEPVAR
jgi:hypothetical protein